MGRGELGAAVVARVAVCSSLLVVCSSLLTGLALVLLPFVANRGERSPARRPWAVGGVTVAVLMVGTLWMAGRSAPWSPVFDTRPLPPEQIGASSGPVFDGAQLFNAKGCQSCHAVLDRGGQRAPDLTHVALRLPPEEIAGRIMIGPGNMPSYAGNLSPEELNDIVAFLESLKDR